MSNSGWHKTDGRITRIIIVDDHPIVRKGLAGLIDQEGDLQICGQAENANEALRVIKELKPDLVIVDISLKDKSGIELIKDIKIRFPELLVLTLSMHDEFLYAERALRAGAKGYVMKAEATESVVKAIRKIVKGQIYVSERLASKMVNRLIGKTKGSEISSVDSLSDRELEVFGLIGKGHGTRHIAEKLHLSVKTIETYRAHIKGKLCLADAAELLQYAIQWVNSKSRI